VGAPGKVATGREPGRGRWRIGPVDHHAHRAAQAIADMVIKAPHSAPGSRSGGTAVPHVPAAVTASGYCQM
jgi:hypothetical protein